ncbi:glycosyl hydrolase 115 family protein [Marasmitruncus massiliensis]|uniref:glycosyl hydrolase 115 family protein n=1 Tax=Marasmitruncus massiliensis TaxID=1944642 RepID=UPI000C7DA693|nr:glycosyl hydrolase 115 family protein [Marasmitruncus massiliensis]
MLLINKNSVITVTMDSESVRRAVRSLRRDIDKAFCDSDTTGAEIRLTEDHKQKTECFQIVAIDEYLEIRAMDALGFIYGIYEISRSLLGITDFWFWNDQKIVPKVGIRIPDDYQYQSMPYIVQFRGWFVNDEVLLHTWSVDRQKAKPWEMTFEALLRCGGNMVIPGTDTNSRLYRKLASDMGLYITHHHAEPLGAEMFARAYPQLNPSYAEYPDKFRQLWLDGIREQKEMRVVWNLGFRGQGDCPFWINDSRYRTPESRGRLMSRLIQIQYEIVNQMVPGAVCCTNLYGETMELYRDGYLKLPEDIIKIWADNGYGKMVTRRQENHNPRIYALPQEGDKGKHGIYYHVSFYDLQAANHITMLPNSPEFVLGELGKVLKHGVRDFWLINCSNIKPHVYFLDFISKVWREGTVNPTKHREEYISRYYGTHNVGKISACLKAYPEYALAYGNEEDEHAGEQFANHVARILISQFMRDKEKRAEDLLWATRAKNLKEQVLWYQALCDKARKGYLEYQRECERTADSISDDARGLFRDSLLLQVEIYSHCFSGAYLVCESLLKAMDGDEQRAFYAAGKAKEEYCSANQAMRDCEHGEWCGFYANECLTDVKQTAWVLEGLMSYLRNLGDGPHFYKWQREFLYPEEDRRVLLILNMENHLKDDELFTLMEARWDS